MTGQQGGRAEQPTGGWGKGLLSRLWLPVACVLAGVTVSYLLQQPNIDELNKTNRDLNRKLSQTSGRLTAAKSRITEQAQKLTETRQDLSGTQDELAETQEELATASGELETAEVALGETQQALEETRGELEQTQSALDTERGAHGDTQDELNETRTELAETKAALDEAEDEATRHHTALTIERGQHTNTKAKLEVTQTDLAATSQQLEETQATLEAEVGKRAAMEIALSASTALNVEQSEIINDLRAEQRAADQNPEPEADGSGSIDCDSKGDCAEKAAKAYCDAFTEKYLTEGSPTNLNGYRTPIQKGGEGFGGEWNVRLEGSGRTRACLLEFNGKPLAKVFGWAVIANDYEYGHFQPALYELSRSNQDVFGQFMGDHNPNFKLPGLQASTP